MPAVSTIRKWFSSINGKPGFSQEAFDALKHRAMQANQNGNEILTCLIFDEVAIRKQEDYDQHNDETIGMVNYGTNIVDSNLNKAAKEAFVFLISGINDKFKIPVAYFLTVGLKANEKAALIRETILFVCKTGVKIVGMTFDGLFANLATCRELGADFKNDRAYIFNPHSDGKIFLYLDACHMLKLARNCLASKSILYDSNGNKIEWRFIENLEEYQRENKMNIANKINKKHIQWKRNKMSVKIAAQTLSNSTADSIDLLREIGIDKFQQSEPLTKYIRYVNNTFDVLNSKCSDDAIGFKRAISLKTHEEFFRFFDEAIEYFQNLRLTMNGRKIINTRSKTAFVGFIMDLKNFRLFYIDYVQSGILSSVPTFRFSQDHLELLFACIRSMFGCNDNPSPRQFESAWRKLLGQHQISASETANCINNDVQILSVLDVSSRKTKPNHIDINQNFTATIDSTEIDHFENGLVGTVVSDNFSSPTDSSEIDHFENGLVETVESDDFSHLCSIVDSDDDLDRIKNHVIHFTASLLQKCIVKGQWYKRIKCSRCLNAFKEDAVTNNDFVNTKMKTNNMLPPSKSTVDICKATEKFMEKFKFEPGHFEDILNDVQTHLKYETLFTTTDFDSHDHGTNHKSDLIRMIVQMYVKKKFDYISRCNTLANHDVLLRHQLRKYVHFKNQ